MHETFLLDCFWLFDPVSDVGVVVDLSVEWLRSCSHRQGVRAMHMQVRGTSPAAGTEKCRHDRRTIMRDEMRSISVSNG